jgi:hypothetical protein
MRRGKLTYQQPFWRACLNRFAIERNLRRELSVAEAAEAVLADKMRELKTRFDRTYPNPQPARLCLHRTGQASRCAGGSPPAAASTTTSSSFVMTNPPDARSSTVCPRAGARGI